MDAATCLKKLEYVGVLAFATVGRDGSPQVRNISAIHYEPDALYFFTARRKDFCQELLADGRVQILGYTKYKEMIRLSACRKRSRPRGSTASLPSSPIWPTSTPGTPGRSAWSLPSGLGRSSTSTWGSAPSSGPPTPLGAAPSTPRGMRSQRTALPAACAWTPAPRAASSRGSPM